MLLWIGDNREVTWGSAIDLETGTDSRGKQGNGSGFLPGSHWESQDSVDYTSKKAQEKVIRKCLNIPV